MSKLINEIGNKYGLLTVIKQTTNQQGRTVWECLCDCGNTKLVRGSDLRGGKITSCGKGCSLKHTRNFNFKDLTGQRFGRLKVLSFKEIDQNHKSVWHCICDCGMECDKLGAHLENGTAQSCGCLHRETMQNLLMNNLIGQKFGKLTVIDKVYNEDNLLMWLCQCECGNLIKYYGRDLTAQRGVYSCGCVRSSYEAKILKFLEENNINFKKEQSFPNLVSQKNRRLRYDFAIYKNNNVIGLIEFQGDQHFQAVEYFGGQEEFVKRQYHDQLKRNYAQTHNIPLLYLTKENDLESEIKFFLNTIKYYN